jgi:hypothetical protein
MALKMEKNKKNVEAMVASDWSAYVCKGCDRFHVDLYNKDGMRFACIAIDGDELTPLARDLMEHAANLAARGDLDLPKTN